MLLAPPSALALQVPASASVSPVLVLPQGQVLAPGMWMGLQPGAPAWCPRGCAPFWFLSSYSREPLWVNPPQGRARVLTGSHGPYREQAPRRRSPKRSMSLLFKMLPLAPPATPRDLSVCSCVPAACSLNSGVSRPDCRRALHHLRTGLLDPSPPPPSQPGTQVPLRGCVRLPPLWALGWQSCPHQAFEERRK